MAAFTIIADYSVSPCGSIQFSHSIMSDSWWPHGLQHARPPYPLPTPGVYSYSCPLSQWCHPTISFSVVPFSSCLQSFPASGSFPMSQFFPSGGQSTVTYSFSISPSNEYSGLISFRMDWFDLFAVQRTLKSLLQGSSPSPQLKNINSLMLSLLYGPTLISIHNHWENYALILWTLSTLVTIKYWSLKCSDFCLVMEVKIVFIRAVPL